MDRLVGGPGKRANQHLSQGCRHETLARQYRVHGSHELLRRLVLGDVARSARPQHVDCVLVLGKTADDEDPRFLMAGADMPQYVDTAAVRHVDIENHEIPSTGAKTLQRLGPGPRLADRIDRLVALEIMPE